MAERKQLSKRKLVLHTRTPSPEPAPSVAQPTTDDETPVVTDIVEEPSAPKVAKFVPYAPVIKSGTRSSVAVAAAAPIDIFMQTPTQSEEFIRWLETPISDEENKATLETITSWTDKKRATCASYGGFLKLGIRQSTSKKGVTYTNVTAFSDPTAPGFPRDDLTSATPQEFPDKFITTPIFRTTAHACEFGVTGNLLSGTYAKESLSKAVRSIALVQNPDEAYLPPAVIADQGWFINALMMFQLETRLAHMLDLPKYRNTTPAEVIDKLASEDELYKTQQFAVRGWKMDGSPALLTIPMTSYVCARHCWKYPNDIPEATLMARCIAAAKAEWDNVFANPIFYGIHNPDGSPNPDDNIVNNYPAVKSLLDPARKNPEQAVSGFSDRHIMLLDTTRLSAASLAALKKHLHNFVAFAIMAVPTIKPPVDAAEQKTPFNVPFTWDTLCLVGRLSGAPVFEKKQTRTAILSKSVFEH